LKSKKSNIAIFNTFKTRRDKFTGEAKRQRGILIHLATEKSPELRTRTSIAHAIAKNNGIFWQNIYSGIFKDLDEVLIPSNIVKEEGRLPLKRGPRALQLEGVPFYELTDTGLLVASSIEELGNSRIKILDIYLNKMSTVEQEQIVLKECMLLLLKIVPSFMTKIIGEYVYAYSTSNIDSIVPFSTEKIRSVVGEHISIAKQFVDAYDNAIPEQKVLIKKFFSILS
jgi:hypothetical protein